MRKIKFSYIKRIRGIVLCVATVLFLTACGVSSNTGGKDFYNIDGTNLTSVGNLDSSQKQSADEALAVLKRHLKALNDKDKSTYISTVTYGDRDDFDYEDYYSNLVSSNTKMEFGGDTIFQTITDDLSEVTMEVLLRTYSNNATSGHRVTANYTFVKTPEGYKLDLEKVELLTETPISSEN